MGNLLSYDDSFNWSNPHIDRGSLIENLSQAIDEATAFGDSIYRTPNLYDNAFPSGVLFEFLVNTNFDDHSFRIRFPWITQTQYQALMGILFIMQVTTPEESETLQELNHEFPNQNNTVLGLRVVCPHFLVHDIDSWIEFHRLYVSTFTFELRRQHYRYFRRFYRPALTMALNWINTQIRLGRINRFIERIDPPLIPHEQIHVHFNDEDESALNIDGTWKHHECRIPIDVRRILSEWGFLLPEICYRLD